LESGGEKKKGVGQRGVAPGKHTREGKRSCWGISKKKRKRGFGGGGDSKRELPKKLVREGGDLLKEESSQENTDMLSEKTNVQNHPEEKGTHEITK